MFRNYIVLGIVYVDKASIRLLYCKVFPHRKKEGNLFSLERDKRKIYSAFRRRNYQNKKKTLGFRKLSHWNLGRKIVRLFKLFIFVTKKNFFFKFYLFMSEFIIIIHFSTLTTVKKNSCQNVPVIYKPNEIFFYFSQIAFFPSRRFVFLKQYYGWTRNEYGWQLQRNGGVLNETKKKKKKRRKI